MFSSARRVWFGYTRGVDWLHQAVEGEFGEDQVWYDVKSERKSIHIGAAGEIAAVVLFLLSVGAVSFMGKFGDRLGEASADGLIEWVRELVARRKSEVGLTDGAPNFLLGDSDQVAESMKRDLAQLAAVPESRLELLAHEKQEELMITARYRDAETGEEYTVEILRDEATFTRVIPSRQEPS
jgi:hypothetical protein